MESHLQRKKKGEGKFEKGVLLTQLREKVLLVGRNFWPVSLGGGGGEKTRKLSACGGWGRGGGGGGGCFGI